MINFFYVRNYQIAFIMFKKNPTYLQNIIIIINSITILNIIKKIFSNNQYNIAYIFILAGAIGNILDRIFYGYIIDFIDINIYNIHLVILNFADIIIIIGIILFIIQNKSKK